LPPPSLVTMAQARLARKAAEAHDLRLRLMHERLEVEACRSHLEAAGVAGHSSSSLVPATMQAGKILADAQQLELRRLLQWLATSVDLSQHVIFDCGAGKGLMQVGGKSVNMHRMAAWQLPPSEGLKLSVPVDILAEVATLLAEAQARGRLPEDVFQCFAADWELISAEVASAPGVVEPAIFLVNCKTSQAIVCACWPVVDFEGPERVCASAPFDPAKHFYNLSALVGDEVPECSPRPCPAWSTGDRVEVEWEGEWFTGVLQWVHGNVANVKCDVDEPGVTTDASITNVRPATVAQAVGERTLPPSAEFCNASPFRGKYGHGHMRAKSIG